MKNLDQNLKDLKAAGKSQDEILSFLHGEGLFIADAIIAIRKLYSIGLKEAKVIVSTSSYWQSQHAHHQELHDALEEALLPYVNIKKDSK